MAILALCKALRETNSATHPLRQKHRYLGPRQTRATAARNRRTRSPRSPSSLAIANISAAVSVTRLKGRGDALREPVRDDRLTACVQPLRGGRPRSARWRPVLLPVAQL